MNTTIRHGLALLAAGQAQKEVTHNEALLVIDRRLQLAVETRGLASPPAAPTAGSCYIVASGASGEWAGQAGSLASHDGFGWTFDRPVRGCLAWIVDEAVFAVFDTQWSDGGWPVTGLRIAGRQVLGAAPATLSPPVGGSQPDEPMRAAFADLLVALRQQGIIA